MVYSLKVAQFGQLLIRIIIQNVDIHPSFSFPTATTQSLYICKCRWTCSSAGQGKKRTGRFPAVQKQMCYNISHSASRGDPPHFHHPNLFQVWGFLHHLRTQGLHIFLPWVTVLQKGIGTWLESSFSYSALSIQMSGYTPALVKKEGNLLRKKRTFQKDHPCTRGTSQISYKRSEEYINVPLTIG